MNGNFVVGLIEMFAYLLPGSIALAAILIRYYPAQIEQMSNETWFQLVFIIGSFISGHILTLISVVLVKVRVFLSRKVFKQKYRHERLSFYSKLETELNQRFGKSMSYSDRYWYSLRLVTEFMPQSTVEINRLYALTLFSRNLVFAFLVGSILFLVDNWLIFSIGLALSIIFIIRYSQLETATGDTVLRAAYVFLCMRGFGNSF